MNKTLCILTIGLLNSATFAQGATANSTFGVSAITEPSCHIQSTDLIFGVIDINKVIESTLNHPIMLNADLNLRCTKGAVIQVEANSLNNLKLGLNPMGFYSGTLEMDGKPSMTIGYQLHLPALLSNPYYEARSRNTTGFGTNTSVTSTDYSLRLTIKTNEAFSIPYTAGIQKSTVNHTKEIGSYNDSVVYTMTY